MQAELSEADNPAGRHSIWTNQRPTSLIRRICTPDALPATLPIYPGLVQAPNMLDCIPPWLGSYPVAWFMPSGVVHTQCLGSYPAAWFIPSGVVHTQWHRLYPRGLVHTQRLGLALKRTCSTNDNVRLSLEYICFTEQIPK